MPTQTPPISRRAALKSGKPLMELPPQKRDKPDQTLQPAPAAAKLASPLRNRLETPLARRCPIHAQHQMTGAGQKNSRGMAVRPSEYPDPIHTQHHGLTAMPRGSKS